MNHDRIQTQNSHLAADQGDAHVQNALGVAYAHSEAYYKSQLEDDAEAIRESQREDDAEAVRWFRLAADQDHADAQYNLGIMYADGWGVPRHRRAARHLFRGALAAGADHAEAVRWFRLAADQGHADAQYNLGIMYANGWGVPQDYGIAEAWYRLAADQDHAGAEETLDLEFTR